MNGPEHRARMWLERGRHDKAEPELRAAIAEAPDDARLHALLAVCLAATDRTPEAIDSARGAVGAAPDDAWVHAVLASVLLDADDADGAEEAALESLRLDPEEPWVFGVLARAHLARARWSDAIAAADAGLEIDPEDAGCLNARAFAKVQRGDRDAAADDLRAALVRDPENAATHTNLGWAALRRRDHHAAAEHYREALRLDPSLEPARAGLLEALRARNPVYRWLMWALLQLTRVPPKVGFAIIIGFVVLQRVLRQVGSSNPELRWIVWPIAIAMGLFILLTWLGAPLMNVVLLFSRDGRLALSSDERRQGIFVGLALALAAMFGLTIAAGFPNLWGALLVSLGLTLVAAVALGVENPRWRGRLRLAALALTVLGIYAAWRVAAQGPEFDPAAMARTMLPFAIGVAGMTWVGSAIGFFGVRRSK